MLKGTATPVKVSKEKASYYKKKGYQVKSGRVIVPHLENEKVYGTHGNFVRKITGKGGSIQVMDLGLDNTNVIQWARDLRANKFKLRANEALRFQMYGNNSFRGFSDSRLRTAQEQMADYLEFYESFESAVELSPEQQSEYVQSIVIFKVKRNPNGSLPIPEQRAEEYPQNIEARERRNRRNAERRLARLGRMTDREYDDYMDARADSEKTRRANMTDAQRARYNEQTKKRVQKHRAAKKAQKK